MVSLSIKRVVSIFILRPIARRSPSPHNNNNNNNNNNARPVAYQYQMEIALFRRCKTMPTFPNHWAGISGSIEDDIDANPFDAAARELEEETNAVELYGKGYHRHGGVGCGDDDDDVDDGRGGIMLLDMRNKCIKQGLHVDVSSGRSEGAFGGRIIRVYPFALTLPSADANAADEYSSFLSTIEMKGTEHDRMSFMNIDDFLQMTEPCVPSLKMAFHHATSGSYLELPKEIRTWEQDRVNGAAFLAREALTLAADHTTHDTDDTDSKPSMALSIAMMRPSMVPIVNVMNEFDRRTKVGEDKEKVRDEILQSLDTEVERCVDLGAKHILRLHKQWQLKQSSCGSKFVIGTFSRSSTMKLILGRVLAQTTDVEVVCSQSTPGNEGELMASDIPHAMWLPDQLFQTQIEKGKLNLVLVGADCILQKGKGAVNKIGTAALATCCNESNVPILCCADRWKLWEDEYPPALEEIFELVPSKLLEHVLVPDLIDDAAR